MVREFLAVAARAALQWALASLLLANGAAFCLIAAAAAGLGLGPPCILCARVHHLLCSSSTGGGGGEERDALCCLLCDAHLAAVSSAPPDHGDGDAVSGRKDGLDADDRDKVSGLKTHRVVSIGSEICEQDDGGERPRAVHRSNVARTSSADGGDDRLVSLFELAPIVSRPRDDDGFLDHATPGYLLTGDDGDGERHTVEQLVFKLGEQRRELEAMRAELASERRGRARRRRSTSGSWRSRATSTGRRRGWPCSSSTRPRRRSTASSGSSTRAGSGSTSTAASTPATSREAAAGRQTGAATTTTTSRLWTSCRGRSTTPRRT